MSEQNSNSQTNLTVQTTSAQSGSSFDQFLSEAGEFIYEFARFAGKAAENITGLMVLPVDKNLRGKMDELVEAGVVKSRGEAALSLLGDGIASNQSVYEEVEKARARITALRSQLRDMIGQHS